MNSNDVIQARAMIFKLRVRVLRAAFSREGERERMQEKKDIRQVNFQESTPIEFRVPVKKKSASRLCGFSSQKKRHNTHAKGETKRAFREISSERAT